MLNQEVISRAKQYPKVVIVGAGKSGDYLFSILQKETHNIVCVFDNMIKEIKSKKISVPIVLPYNLNEKVLYIVAVNKKNQESIVKQLCELGINSDDIYKYTTSPFDYDYISQIDPSLYEQIIKEQYRYYLNKNIDLKNPKTYNEIINWEKINLHDKRRTILADKVKVREWVAGKIGQQYLNEIYGIWENADDIDFDKLPDSFVLKTNNASAHNVVVKNKKEIDRKQICEMLNGWLERNYAYVGLEMQYEKIEPRIIAEKYLDGVAESVYEYDVFCFHGEPQYIWCINGSHLPWCKASFYDLDWKMQPFSYGYPKDEIIAPKPIQFEEMIAKTKILAEDFEHVRVDWFLLPTGGGEMYFGEMTFSTWGGYMEFVPPEMDEIFGSLILHKFYGQEKG